MDNWGCHVACGVHKYTYVLQAPKDPCYDIATWSLWDSYINVISLNDVKRGFCGASNI